MDLTVMPPIVGIPACARLVVNGQLRHDTPARYPAAVLGGAGAVPILIPPLGEASLAVLDVIDGLLLPGSPSNVHPSHYAGGDSLTPDHHDLERDATTLRLIPEALARGIPLLAICRGVQELNVALGGTLHQQVHAVTARMDHRPGPGTLEEKYAPRHLVLLSGELARIVGSTKILVNSLHGQAIDVLAPGLVVEAVAPDDTIEAVRVAGAQAFALGVQWHPEWGYADDSASLAIFRAFGEACAAYRAGLRRAA
ncbi:MAG TPA: gamma-glutamyl-gamma-aminobutyrate hydrolase family protein [Acetobacteraceae bacterium]|nr:gamma-glutamyl-gamma-aminobutyrate hydrolase family protein [Acetobacteraceae bacterium]